MKVTIIMGRGIEGCGVSKYTVEMTKWLERNGHDYTIIASKDKTWSRKDAHSFKNLMHLKFSVDENIETIINKCNEADFVIVNSLPSRKYGASKGHDPKVGINFIRIINEVKSKIVLIQHDHNKLSIVRNDGLEEYVKRADVIFAHSPDGDFAREVQKMNGTSGFMSFVENTEPRKIMNFQPGMYFDEVRQKYWKPISQQDKMVHRWVGRTTFWKGFGLMFDFHNNYLKNSGALTVLEGIEKSPAYIDFKNRFDFTPMLDKNPDKEDLTSHYGDKAVVFSFFKNVELLERMSKSGFGYQLSLMDPRFIEHSIEYTHCEVAATGCIPVFRKEYGDACKHIKHGDPLSQCKDSGTIWLSDSNMQECMDLITRINNDDSMREDWREKAFEFYKSHQDASVAFDRLFSDIRNELNV